MSTVQEQNIDVVGILSSAIAISGSSATTFKNKTKTVPHKATKTVASSTNNGAKKRSWKKPADKPKRPLSAYNLFFKAERARLISGGTSSASKSFGGLLPGLPLFPTIGAAATGSADGILATAAEEKILMQVDALPAMDKLMSEAF